MGDNEHSSSQEVEEVKDDDGEVAEVEDDDDVAEADEDVHILEDDDEAASEDCKKNGEEEKGRVNAAKGNEKEEEEGKDGEDVITVDDSVEPDIVPKTVPDSQFFESVSEDEKKFYEENARNPDSIEQLSVQCTACWKQVNHHQRNNIMRHPDLGVPVCRSCKYFYEDDGVWEKDEQGSDCYCRWCANGGEMVCCDKCTSAYCKQCIIRNFSRKKFTEINDCDHWDCFQCDPKPIYPQRALMYSIYKWYSSRKDRKKVKDTKKISKKIAEQKQKKVAEEESKIENFIDENIHEALDTLRIYQKCLEDEKRKWMKNKKKMTVEGAGGMVAKLRKIYGITKQNMELLDSALVQGYADQFPGESMDRFKPGRFSTGSLKKTKSSSTTPAMKANGANGTPVSDINGTPASGINKRKIKNTEKKGNMKKQKLPGGDGDGDDEEIAVEEIVVNGEAVLGDKEFFDPSQLCSIQITGLKGPPAPPRIPPVKRPTGPLRLSSSMFKKKSPSKPKQSRPVSPDSDIEEIFIDDDTNDNKSSDVDSDVSLDC